MSVLICGALTYDTVMVINEKLKNHISATAPLPTALDIHFQVPDLRRQFGGCAGNIAYNLKILGAEPLIMATVGTDFNNYAEWLDKQGIRRDYITKVDHCVTAQKFTTIDMEDNQITAFHAGAMNFSYLNHVQRAKNITLGVVCGDSAEGMLLHTQQFAEAGIPFVFAPGNSIQQFDGDELMRFIEQANWIMINKKVWMLMQQRIKLTPEQVAMRVQALLISSEKGSLIYTQGTRYQIPPAQFRAMNDWSGADEAFCAGLLYGLLKDIDWETTGRIANLMTAIKIEHHGSQSHNFTLEQFKLRFRKHFGYSLLI
jgi:adenosine kinase